MAAAETLADVALDQAVRRIGELSQRLWAVSAAHQPAPGHRLRRRPRCADCGRPCPCPTAQAALGRSAAA